MIKSGFGSTSFLCFRHRSTCLAFELIDGGGLFSSQLNFFSWMFGSLHFYWRILMSNMLICKNRLSQLLFFKYFMLPIFLCFRFLLFGLEMKIFNYIIDNFFPLVFYLDILLFDFRFKSHRCCVFKDNICKILVFLFLFINFWLFLLFLFNNIFILTLLYQYLIKLQLLTLGFFFNILFVLTFVFFWNYRAGQLLRQHY